MEGTELVFEEMWGNADGRGDKEKNSPQTQADKMRITELVFGEMIISVSRSDSVTDARGIRIYRWRSTNPIR